MTGKKMIRLVPLAIFLAVLAVLAFMINDTPMKKAERFVTRCAPDWEAAFEALAASGGNAERGNEMPGPLMKIFRNSRGLRRISMIDGETVDCVFDWYYSGEEHRYVFFQKEDDCQKNGDIAMLAPWNQTAGINLRTEESENRLRVTGFGAGSKGYIDIVRIRPCWFYVDAYFPT